MFTARAALRPLRSVDRVAAVTGRSGRGRWERVLAARRQADEALGLRTDGQDALGGPPKRKPPAQSNVSPPRLAPLHPSERSELVLSLGEVAARLGVRQAELEAMIAAGKIEALPRGFTCMVPSSEVERLSRDTRKESGH
jgi:hypothetical protein